MEFCKTLLSLAATIGFYPVQSGGSKFNWRNVGIFVSFVINTVSSTVCLLFESKTVQDYEQTFFVWIMLFIMTVNFYIMILRVPKLYQVLDRVVIMIGNRKSNY